MGNLKLSEYTPNLKDSRIVNSIIRAMTFAAINLNRHAPFQISIKQRREVFGNATRQELALWLESKLLVDQCAGYVVGSRAKLYKVSKTGYYRLERFLVENNIVDSEFRFNVLQDKYRLELSGVSQFEYFEKSHRWWHLLQFEKKVDKPRLFKPQDGWTDWDISAALPSMFILTHINKCNARFDNQYVSESIGSLPFIHQYITHKDQIRNELASHVGITRVQVKKIINALFLGARLSPHEKCTIFRELGFDLVKLGQLKNAPFIVGLKKDIKKFWNTTWKLENLERKIKGEEEIPKNKYYFFLEFQVLKAVNSFLLDTGLPFFLEHDGFKIKGEIDMGDLQNYVNEQVGIKLNWE